MEFIQFISQDMFHLIAFVTVVLVIGGVTIDIIKAIKGKKKE